MEIREDLVIKDARPYVLWRRVSTEQQGESGLGLDAQLTLARTFTNREPERIFTDVYSGTKLKECQGLKDAIEYCKSHGCFLLIAKTDRFRNVREALEVIDSIGERNISFCDMPNVDRMILTIMFSVWERQAYMGRINTKLALEERKRQARENGGWIAKSGKWRTKLGSEASGVKLQKMCVASASASIKRKEDWCESSNGFKWCEIQLRKGVSRKEIIEEFNRYGQMGMDGFCTRNGKPLTKGVLSRWIQIMLKRGSINQ